MLQLRKTWPALTLALVLLAGCGAAAAGSAGAEAAGTESYVRSGSAEGGVAVTATLALPAYFAASGLGQEADRLRAGDGVLVKLEFETHQGDLSRYDAVANSSLVTDQASVSAVEWIPVNNDSHHRAGYLRFPARAVAGSRLTLQLRNLAGVPSRSFEWIVPGGGGGR